MPYETIAYSAVTASLVWHRGRGDELGEPILGQPGGPVAPRPKEVNERAMSAIDPDAEPASQLATSRTT